MAVPKRKVSKARRDKRKATWFKRMVNNMPGLTTCTECGEIKMSHRVCKSCGAYRGKKVNNEEN